MFIAHFLCDPIDSSPPGSSVHGILQARIVQCVAIPFSRGSPQPRGQIWVSCIAGGFFTSEPPGKSLEGPFMKYFLSSGTETSVSSHLSAFLEVGNLRETTLAQMCSQGV